MGPTSIYFQLRQKELKKRCFVRDVHEEYERGNLRICTRTRNARWTDSKCTGAVSSPIRSSTNSRMVSNPSAIRTKEQTVIVPLSSVIERLQRWYCSFELKSLGENMLRYFQFPPHSINLGQQINGFPVQLQSSDLVLHYDHGIM